jgi:hypothetical protein
MVRDGTMLTQEDVVLTVQHLRREGLCHIQRSAVEVLGIRMRGGAELRTEYN